MGLVLSRKKNEAVYVNVPGVASMTVRVVKLGDGKVKLHFDADPSFEIIREELVYAQVPKSRLQQQPSRR